MRPPPPFAPAFPGASFPPPAPPSTAAPSPSWPPAVPPLEPPREGRVKTRVDDASTRSRSVSARRPERAKKSRTLQLVAGVGVASLLLGVGLFVGLGGLGSAPDVPPTGDPTAAPSSPAASPDRALLDEARKYATDHPDDVAEQVSRFQEVAAQARDTEVARTAGQLADDARGRLSQAAKAEADKLLDRAHDAERRKDYEVACAILDRPPTIVARDEKLSSAIAVERRRLGHARGLARARSALASHDPRQALAEVRDLLSCGDASVESEARALATDAEKQLAQAAPPPAAGPGPEDLPREGPGPGSAGPPAGPAGGRPPRGMPQEPTREQWARALEDATKIPLADFLKAREAALAEQKKLAVEWGSATVAHAIGVREDGKRLKGQSVSAAGRGLEHCEVGRVSPDDPILSMAFGRPEQSRLEFAADPDDPPPARVALRLVGRGLAPSTAPDLVYVRLHVSVNATTFDDLVVYTSDSVPTVLEVTKAWQPGQKNVIAVSLAKALAVYALARVEVIELGP